MGRGAYLFLIFFIFFLFPHHIYAQEHSGEVLQQLEKKDIVPKEKPKGPPSIKKEEKPKEVKGPAGPKILIKKFKPEGNTLLRADLINSILSANENKELTFAEIQAVADLITAQYREAGYILANAFVPAQDIKDGVVTIKIISAVLR
ncbi:MAG: hypothetical protein EPN22_01550 [Nitrospirae bacterium]|nr:MAG: hypothetical protein EPN22_01550 [Nitrospirota bacterium]